MNKFLIVIVLLLAVHLYSEEIDLIPRAQLPAIGADYSFSYPVEMTILDGELFILDQKNARILVFDANNLKYKRAFGSFGSEPVQFNKPVAIISDNDGNLIVSDYGNGRIQYITQTGQEVDIIDKSFSWRFSSWDGEIYADLFPGVPQAGIYRIENGDFEQVIDLGEYFEKKKFHSVLDKYYSWCAYDAGFILSFSSRDRVVMFNHSGKAIRNKIDPLPLELPNTLYGKPFPFRDGFLLLGSANDHVRADTTNTEINYEGVIGYYDYKGTLLKTYRLPDLPWLSDAWTLDDNKLYIYDSGRFIINKFIID